MPPTSRKGSVIVFDPVAQTMSTEKLKHLGWSHFHLFIILRLTPERFSGEPVIEQPTPRWQSHVLIYADALTEPEPERRLVAALNLDKLGWSTNVKRLFGRRSQIYVMERPRRGGSPISSS